MDTKKRHILLKDLEVYKLARQLSGVGWEIYKNLNWQDKKTMGNQFITAVDSVGANIAEGYGRYHFLDKIRFLYIARASLAEALEHWLGLLKERDKISKEDYTAFFDIANKTSLKLQNFIFALYKAKSKIK